MNIRPYREADYESVLDIYASSKLDEFRFEETKFDLLRLEDDPVRCRELMESEIYVCVNKGVVGYGALFKSEIRALFVSPKARGQGVGKTLLKFLLAKTPGSESLYVARSNTPARQLYESLGFENVGEFETQYNGQAVFAIKMRRREQCA